MGLFGSLLSIAIQSALADRHYQHRAVALTEMNVAASISASLVPLAIGGFDRIGLGWRSAIFLVAIALVAISQSSIAKLRSRLAIGFILKQLHQLKNYRSHFGFIG